MDPQLYMTSRGGPHEKTVHFLPAFDEFIISYKDRKAALNADGHKRVISRNGIFWPVVVVNGKVAATWKRSFRKDRVVIEIATLPKTKKSSRKELENAVSAYGQFLEKTVRLGL